MPWKCRRPGLAAEACPASRFTITPPMTKGEDAPPVTAGKICITGTISPPWKRTECDGDQHKPASRATHPLRGCPFSKNPDVVIVLMAAEAKAKRRKVKKAFTLRLEVTPQVGNDF